MSTNREINEKKRYERLLFEYGTTARTDYRDYGPPTPSIKQYREKPKKPRKIDARVKDIHTLTYPKNTIPFNAFLKPKPIVQTSPYTVQKAYTHVRDKDLEEIIKTRPRLIISPALSIDDVPEPQRSLLIEQCYTSDMNAHNKEASSGLHRSSVQAPLPGLPSSPRPVQSSLPKLRLPMVPYEWRMDSCSWDGRQLRSSIDTAKEFWRRRPLNKCQPCEQSARLKAMGKII